MPVVGTSIDLLGVYVASTFQYPVSEDPSQDLLFALAIAQNAVRRLEDLDVDLVLQGRHLVTPALQQAYREAQFIRSKRMTMNGMVDTHISRFGRLR